MSKRPSPSRVYMLRHARAGWAGSGQRDFDRALDQRGRDDAARMALAMVERGFVPSLVLCSPARRCAETWEIVARQVSTEPAIHDELLYSGEESDYLERIRRSGVRGSILLCGHNPMIAAASDLLLEPGDHRGTFQRTGFRKGALAVMDLDGPIAEAGRIRASLVAYLVPDDM